MVQTSKTLEEVPPRDPHHWSQDHVILGNVHVHLRSDLYQNRDKFSEAEISLVLILTIAIATTPNSKVSCVSEIRFSNFVEKFKVLFADS